MTLFHDNILNRRVIVGRNSAEKMVGKAGTVRMIEWSDNGWESSTFIVELDEDRALSGFKMLQLRLEPLK